MIRKLMGKEQRPRVGVLPGKTPGRGGMSLVPEEAVPRGDSHYLAVSLCPASHLLCQESRVYKPKPNSVSFQCTQIKGGAKLGACKPERNTSLTDAAAAPQQSILFLPGA